MVKKKKIKKILFPLIMCIITFLIGVIISYISIGVPLKTKLIILLVSFLPFLLFLLMTIFGYMFNEKRKLILTFKIISAIITCLLLFYYFFAIFFIALECVMNPVSDPKYYGSYVNNSYLYKVFPKKIPNDVEDVKFIFYPSVLQGGELYSLYFIDKNMTLNKFNEKYKEKAIWIGKKEEYTEKRGLLPSFFELHDEEYKETDDYIIYLINGECDDSGYCNHGEYLLAAYNDKTKEIVFQSKRW